MIGFKIHIVGLKDPPPMVGCDPAGELTIESIGVLEGGMQSGKTSLWLVLNDGKGKTYCAQTSAELIVNGLVPAIKGAEQKWQEDKHRN